MNAISKDEGLTASTGRPQTPISSPPLPAPPSPSADAAIAPRQGTPPPDPGHIPQPENIDIFTLSSIAALKILCKSLDILVHITGDVPPTPPLSLGPTAKSDMIAREQENIVRVDKNDKPFKRRSRQWLSDDGDVPTKAKTPIGSPEALPTEPLHVRQPEAYPQYGQQGAIIRKFYSKKPPSIALEGYLMRLQRYCPMSTAVYLATSLYIYRLAIVSRILPVTSRNAHRLVLAGLRVAMKALEDLSYPHSRFAKVGGVTENELARLEISFCFVSDFNLRVTSEMLLEHAKMASQSSALAMTKDFALGAALLKDKRNIVLGRSKPMAERPQMASIAVD